MVKRKGLAIFALALGAAVLAGAAIAQQTNIAIATGGTGGVYYPLGGGMANVLSKDRKSTRLNSSHSRASRMPSSA